MNSIGFMDIRKYSHKKRVHFFFNIIVGLLIVLGTHFIQNTELGESAMNWALDFFIKHEAQKTTIKNKEDKILYIDINADTYERWGKPLLIPRDKLAFILECAHDGGAKVVVVDILFDYKDCCNPKGDKKLRKVLEDIHKSKSSLKIVFPILVHQNGKLSNNIFSDLIAENNGANFHYGLPYISETQKDSVTRYCIVGDVHAECA
jgi:CHASE2 domain-containing sensor protein